MSYKNKKIQTKLVKKLNENMNGHLESILLPGTKKLAISNRNSERKIVLSLFPLAI